tara:strand:+ start:1189 stop:1782 length:594 start_codon:yes stop_codon:yes gene_type:complete
MAYPTVSAPYGLVPINLIGGQVFAGATRQIPITTASGTSIFCGDVVKLNSDGTLSKDVGTDAATPVGVFLGCSYTDPTFGKTFRQFFLASTAADDIMAYVCDDPDALFKVAVVSTTTTIGGVTRTAVGNNAILVQNAGSTINGNSKVAIGATTATTNTFPVRIIDLVAETKNASGSYTEVIVGWVAGMHQYRAALGV